MIKLFLSLLIIILILIFFWRFMFNYPAPEQETRKNGKKRVKFSKKILEIPPEQIKENFEDKPSEPKKETTSNLANLEKTYKEINPANFYTQDFNTPNFTTNVTDLRDFYSYDNPPNDSTAQVAIPKEPYDIAPRINKNSNEIQQQVASDPSWLVPQKQNASGLEWQTDFWTYKNEVPMNGGDFGGITGYESMGDGYSNFYTKTDNDIVIEQEALLKPTDDLRNGMGTPQKQAYEYNMSNP